MQDFRTKKKLTVQNISNASDHDLDLHYYQELQNDSADFDYHSKQVFANHIVGDSYNEFLRSSIIKTKEERETEVHNFQRVVISPPELDVTQETKEVCELIVYALDLREKYIFAPQNPAKEFSCFILSKSEMLNLGKLQNYEVYESDGVFQVRDFIDKKNIKQAPAFAEYAKDLYHIMQICSYGPAKTISYRRMEILESKFQLHVTMNSHIESAIQKKVPHRDFYNIRKVDGHVHLSSAMNHKHLLKFIKKKLSTNRNDVVIFRDGKTLTLQEVFDSLNLSASALSVDTLDVHAHNDIFHRFDKFNLKYNPCGQSRLREIFLKTDNYIQGKYFAELTKEIINDLEVSKYQLAEYRISIYGRSKVEWQKLASWVLENNLLSDNIRWLIQIPRLYSLYRKDPSSGVTCFFDLIDNIFQPLFEVTVDPSKDITLYKFLLEIVGFDCVDDESKPERPISKGIPSPREWTTEKNPPYDYWMYYIYANLYNLNCLREMRGLNTFAFRPHSGEAGEANHLGSTFLVGNAINHGLNLRKTPVLEYLYYLAQIGIAMSPLSNNALFLNYSRNPFPNYFARGLNVTLSTDDPLQFHYSREAIIEEYSVAKAVWKLTSTDLSEIARNSVLQSGFDYRQKVSWLGSSYWEKNNINKTNVPDVRITFRKENLETEFQFLSCGSVNVEDLWRKLSRW